MIIPRAVLVPYVNAAETPDFPVRVFAPDEREGDYLSRVAERLMTGDGSRATRLAEGSVQQKLLNDFLLHAFGEAANALLPVADDALRTQEAPLEGFDLALTRTVARAVPIPVIASGGVGSLEHFAEGVIEGEADAVLAASVFHFGTYSIRQVKEYMAAQGIPVRLDF